MNTLLGSYSEPLHTNDETTSAEQYTPKILLDRLKHQGLPSMSPYLDLVEKIQKDPSIFQNTQPQYLIPEGQEQGSGRFEQSLSRIGISVACGYSGGLFFGAYNTLISKEWKEMVAKAKKGNDAWKNRWAMILTNTNKHGSRYAQFFGSAVLMYSFFNFALSYEEHLERHEIVRAPLAGLITGAIYRSTTKNNWETGKGSIAGALLAFGLTFIEMDPEKRSAIFGF